MARLNPCPVCGCEAISKFLKVVPLQFAYEHCGICGGYRNDWKAARLAWNKTTAEWILEKERTKVDRHTATECAYKNGFAAGMKAAEEKIVRCKDCKHLERYQNANWCEVFDDGYHPDDDDFCSRGERRENGR